MDLSYADDADLVAALRAGDEDAFCWLVDTYSARLHRLARSFVHTAAAAEEVVQETWLAVIRGIAGFEGRSSVATWVYRILSNQARRRGARDHRSIPMSAIGGDDEPVVAMDNFFPAGHEMAGHWASTPSRWQDLPPEQLEAPRPSTWYDARSMSSPHCLVRSSCCATSKAGPPPRSPT